MNTCKYCGHKFRKREWHTEEEKEVCFGCKTPLSMLTAMKLGISFGKGSQKSKDYWIEQFNILTKQYANIRRNSDTT
tara:strand:+ start:2117 stop:2347 length:231 start_codon:yes stop_codon:yes gene_type:complete